VDFDGARALAALEQLDDQANLDEDFLNHHCINVITAIRRLCDWVA
jgi:aspartate aminotransferase